MSGTIPIVLGPAGMVTKSPKTVQTELLAAVAATNPGYTANLPGTLIEDISSTSVAAILACDSALVELVNSITPYGANQFILNQLGQIYGVQQGQETNTSVFVVFSGTVGYIIPIGFTVSDGTYNYTVQGGGVISSGGSSEPLYCLATNIGSWSVPANSVTTVSTSVPTPNIITCNNPLAGTPSTGAQSIESYRAQVLQAGLASSQGVPRFLKTRLSSIPGVQPRLISIVQEVTNWKIIVGGGDPYLVALAIYESLFDISNLVGSTTTLRNQTVTITDYPNTYSVTYVVPPVQSVNVGLTWNTISPNVISNTTVSALGAAALVDYVNSIPVGNPVNLFELQNVFQESISSILPPRLLTRMIFTIQINGTITNPSSGTGAIYGDAEGYFLTDTTKINILRG
jgi:hypothetical protein